MAGQHFFSPSSSSQEGFTSYGQNPLIDAFTQVHNLNPRSRLCHRNHLHVQFNTATEAVAGFRIIGKPLNLLLITQPRLPLFYILITILLSSSWECRHEDGYCFMSTFIPTPNRTRALGADALLPPDYRYSWLTWLHENQARASI